MIISVCIICSAPNYTEFLVLFLFEQDSCRDVIRLPRYRPEKDSKKRKVAVQEDDFTVTVVHRSPAKELPDDWEDIVAQVGKGEDRRENEGKIPSKELDDAVEMMLKADNDAQLQFEMPEQQTEVTDYTCILCL